MCASDLPSRWPVLRSMWSGEVTPYLAKGNRLYCHRWISTALRVNQQREDKMFVLDFPIMPRSNGLPITTVSHDYDPWWTLNTLRQPKKKKPTKKPKNPWTKTTATTTTTTPTTSTNPNQNQKQAKKLENFAEEVFFKMLGKKYRKA